MPKFFNGASDADNSEGKPSKPDDVAQRQEDRLIYRWDYEVEQMCFGELAMGEDQFWNALPKNIYLRIGGYWRNMEYNNLVIRRVLSCIYNLFPADGKAAKDSDLFPFSIDKRIERQTETKPEDTKENPELIRERMQKRIQEHLDYIRRKGLDKQA